MILKAAWLILLRVPIQRSPIKSHRKKSRSSRLLWIYFALAHPCETDAVFRLSRPTATSCEHVKCAFQLCRRDFDSKWLRLRTHPLHSVSENDYNLRRLLQRKISRRFLKFDEGYGLLQQNKGIFLKWTCTCVQLVTANWTGVMICQPLRQTAM